ncbi:MAG: ABC-ATPase domain-containing protein [Gemmatimonadota bacterium]|nr:MAG: ABC-ATPase domain-containing protein [Gemmatimonadota bacterium]
MAGLDDQGAAVRDANALEHVLQRIDGKGYKAYHEIKGEWTLGDITFVVDHVQGDPFAAPSRVTVFVPPEIAALPPESLASEPRLVGVAAYLARRFGKAARSVARSRGSGKSGTIEIETPGQEVLRQSAVTVRPDGAIEARFAVGLPAAGRRVLGSEAAALLTGDVPTVVRASLRDHVLDEVISHALVNEDAEALRHSLADLDLVAFVADGASLPRRSGIDPRPLVGERVVEFESPESMRVTVELPNAGPVQGMGVPPGVTLIVGGGYHGKSTLLKALEQGVYNHRPGDGRERVATVDSAVKVRAEDGRSVTGVDISPFIRDLPGGEDTRVFSTPNASGSTSQAASIMEAIEAGATVLIVDEDTAATNFMIRDRRMQELVPKGSEPITPLVDRVRQLHASWGVSSVLVLGGSGDYLDVADTVVMMDRYVARDITNEARRVAAELPTGRIRENADELGARPARVPLPGSVDPSRGKRDCDIKVHSRDRVQFGRGELDLSGVEQLVSRAQTRAVCHALALLGERLIDGETTVAELLGALDRILAEGGLDALDPRRAGDLAAFRRFELVAVLSRLRTLAVAPEK